MCALRQWLGAVDPAMSDEKVYSVAGETLGASLIELNLAGKRFRKAVLETDLFQLIARLLAWLHNS